MATHQLLVVLILLAAGGLVAGRPPRAAAGAMPEASLPVAAGAGRPALGLAAAPAKAPPKGDVVPQHGQIIKAEACSNCDEMVADLDSLKKEEKGGIIGGGTFAGCVTLIFLMRFLVYARNFFAPSVAPPPATVPPAAFHIHFEGGAGRR